VEIAIEGESKRERSRRGRLRGKRERAERGHERREGGDGGGRGGVREWGGEERDRDANKPQFERQQHVKIV